MRNTKRRIEPLSFFDHTGISRHLEKMAAKGWMIEKIVNTGWVCFRIQLSFLPVGSGCYLEHCAWWN